MILTILTVTWADALLAVCFLLITIALFIVTVYLLYRIQQLHRAINELRTQMKTNKNISTTDKN